LDFTVIFGKRELDTCQDRDAGRHQHLSIQHKGAERLRSRRAAQVTAQRRRKEQKRKGKPL
jgi:hypothetical protein